MGNRENIIEIENKIKQIVGDDPDGLKLIISKEVKEQLESLLFDRMCLLNGMFEWTPLNVQRVQKVNDHLKFLSDSLLERYLAIESKSSIICDNPAFDYDYEIDGSLRFSYNGDRSILHLEDDSFYGSDFNLMCATIDMYFSQNTWKSPLFVKLDDLNWNIECLNHKDLKLCYVTHCFCCHGLFSIPDFIRLNDFWAEIMFTEQSITQQDGTRFMKEDNL
ncbi:MAG: hypothetical protein J1E02_02505 [Coprobacter sp.]|nr:hypothetical protein [Coprobacter sp.]